MTIVVGSSWPKDENLLLDLSTTMNLMSNLLSRPQHKDNQIAVLKDGITKNSLFSSGRKNLADFDVFIIDSIGILTKSIVMLTLLMSEVLGIRVHNLLEPATFGVPIVRS
jgi:3-deoxy-D-manno-octulosonic-acid transferase